MVIVHFVVLTINGDVWAGSPSRWFVKHKSDVDFQLSGQMVTLLLSLVGFRWDYDGMGIADFFPALQPPVERYNKPHKIQIFLAESLNSRSVSEWTNIVNPRKSIGNGRDASLHRFFWHRIKAGRPFAASNSGGRVGLPALGWGWNPNHRWISS